MGFRCFNAPYLLHDKSADSIGLVGFSLPQFGQITVHLLALFLCQLFVRDIEHCAYFSLNSLITAFNRAGFDVVASDESFGGQFIWVEARPGSGHSKVTLAEQQTPEHIRQYVDAFADQYQANVQAWRERLVNMARERRRAVVWGAGSKGVTFLNVLNDHAADIRHVVDLNPHKQGRYVAGSGQQVVPPDFLCTSPATDVIVMNPLYLDEITAAVRAMGLDMRISNV